MALLKPNLCVPDITKIDFAALAASGLVNVILDVDGTIAKKRSWSLANGVAKHLNWAIKNGRIKKLCLVSNIVWPWVYILPFGPDRRTRIKKFVLILKASNVCAVFPYLKPHPLPFIQAMQLMKSEPQNTAVVGNNLKRDISGGKQAGCYTILVSSLPK